MEGNPPCPHCGPPIWVDSMPPCHEVVRCGNCWLRSPLFPRYAPGGGGLRPSIEWLKQLERASEPMATPREAARAVIVAWDRQNATDLARAVEALRAIAYPQ